MNIFQLVTIRDPDSGRTPGGLRRLLDMESFRRYAQSPMSELGIESRAI